MDVTSAQYTDAAHTSIHAVIDGQGMSVPVAEGNRHYRAILDSGIAIAEPDPPTDADWYAAIENCADSELGKGVSYTASDGVAYTIRTGASARSLISGAHSATERADRLGNAITRKVPTQNNGVVAFGNADLVGIFEAVEGRHQACMTRVADLHTLVADGTITESDLNSGWPT